MVDTAGTQATLLSAAADGLPDGSYNPQKQRNFIVSMPLPNITHAPFRPNFPPYNARFDNSTDDTAAWASLLTDVASRVTAQGGAEIFMPEGTSFVQANTIALPSYVYMRGAGVSATTLKVTGTANANPLINVSGASSASHSTDICLQDFNIWGNGTQTGPMVLLYYGNRITMDRFAAGGSTGPGIRIVETWDSIFNNCRWLFCSTDTSASAYTTSDEGGGTAIGKEVIQILSATAGSGFGSSADSCNQLRFNDNLIETFSVGAIAIVSTSFNSVGAHDIQFHGTKIEGGNGGANFTGKYMALSMSGTCQNILLADSFIAYDGISSGANVGSQGLIYWTAGGGNVIRRIMSSISGALQFGVKAWGSTGAVIDGFTANGTAFTNGAYWQAGGSPIDWNDIRGSAATTPVYPTYFAPRIPSMETSEDSINAIGGAATPGTALSSQYRMVNRVTTVAGGAFVQLPAGVASPRSAKVTVINSTASTLSVMPPTGGTVAGGSTDTAVTMATNTRRDFNSVSTTAWW